MNLQRNVSNNGWEKCSDTTRRRRSETDIPNDLCAECREFPLKASNKRVNVCTYQYRIRVDVREFINDRETINGFYFTSREFISFNWALPFVRHEVLRQMEILRNASNCQDE